MREERQGKDVGVDRPQTRRYVPGVARLARSVATGFKRDVPPRAEGDVTRFRRVSRDAMWLQRADRERDYACRADEDSDSATTKKSCKCRNKDE